LQYRTPPRIRESGFNSARAQHRPGAHELSQHWRFDTAAAGHRTLIGVEQYRQVPPVPRGSPQSLRWYRRGRAGPARQHAGGHARQQAACTRLQASGSGSAGAHHVQWALGGGVCGRDEQVEVRRFLPLHPDALCRACVPRLRVKCPKPGGRLRTVHSIRRLLGWLDIAADWAAIIDEQGRGCK
jgi:hypothetical protein